MNAKIYWNFTRKRWSVQNARTGRVVAHRRELVLFMPTFSVSQAGRLRVLRERRKNVHAKVAGMTVPCRAVPTLRWERVRYNPYRDETFVSGAGDRVDTAKYAHFRPDGTVWALYPRENSPKAALETPQSRKILVS